MYNCLIGLVSSMWAASPEVLGSSLRPTVAIAFLY